jgi:hypothetical protein
MEEILPSAGAVLPPSTLHSTIPHRTHARYKTGSPPGGSLSAKPQGVRGQDKKMAKPKFVPDSILTDLLGARPIDREETPWTGESFHGTIATNLGGLAIRRSLANFLCRCTFDRACKEIDLVYRESSG